MPRVVGFPLSFFQITPWILHQDAENRTICNVPGFYYLRGKLDVAAFQQSLDEVVRRHEVLRTTYRVDDGIPASVVHPARPLPLTVIDLRSLPEEEREPRARHLAAQDADRSFDLTCDIMLRVSLFQVRDEEYFLLLTGHRIAWDASSLGITFRELASLYNSVDRMNRPSLPELPIQYGDFARSHAEADRESRFDELVLYWKDRLAGSADVLPLTIERQRPARRTFRGAHGRWLLDAGLASRLELFGRKERGSLFMVLFSAFQTLLHRYTGSEDVVTGSPVSCRNAQTDHLIGSFVNLIPLRTDFSGDPTFLELLVRIRKDVLDAQAHKDLPFEKMLEALNRQRSASYHPVFQAMFQLKDTHEETPELAGLTVEGVDFTGHTAELDLILEVRERPEGLLCVLNYNTDLFEAGSIQRMLGHYQVILEAVVRDPECRVSRLPILTEEERSRILVEWNDTRVEFPHTSVHEMFEEQARRTPEAVAVVDEDRQLSYADLNARANRLARALVTSGVGRNVMVGICTERSVEMVVGLLAILKAGGAYVPLEPSSPPERLGFMLADLRSPVLLGHKRFLKLFPQHRSTLFPVEEWPQIMADHSPENLGSYVDPNDLAYMLYTSGSTGRPKGVLIPHGALTNYLCWCRAAYSMDQGRGSPVHTPIGFDLTITSLFPPLLAGRTAVLIPEDSALEGLSVAIRSGDFSLVKLTPAHLEALSHRYVPQQARIGTRMFVIGGEALMGETLAFWRKKAPSVRLINEYGPTEATVGCCVYEVPAGSAPQSAVPIGRPISNVRLYVLDRNLQPVPIGVPGELHIAGAGLALGYHCRPEVTAEKFIADPFSTEPGARLYKTGDLARYRSDGTLEFLGRLDNQVKIRGFRIELGEIEAALAEHAAVREVVVTVWEAAAGDRRLVAYMVLDQSAAPSEEQLHNFLKGRLPDYMLPARYLFLPAFPLTSNGKVDRQALPLPTQVEKAGAVPVETAYDELELRLARIWEEVLCTRPIGMKEDFFDLGGNSLLIMKLLMRIEQVFGIKVSQAALLQAPTIEALAFVLRHPNSFREPELLAVQPNGSRPAFFCVSAGSLFRRLAHRLGFDQPFFGLPLPELEELPASRRLEDFAAHCVRVLLAKQPAGPYYLGGWSDWGVLAYEIAQQLTQQGQRVALLVLFDAENPAYMLRFAGLERARALLSMFGQWMDFHWQILRRLELRGAFGYLGLAVRGRLSALQRRIWRTAYRVQQRVGRPIDSGPETINRVLAFAVSEYQPRPYTGRVLLFRRDARPVGRYRDPEYGWGQLVGTLQIENVPGAHVDMFLQPGVEIVAEKLDACLREAQESNRSMISSTRSSMP